MNKQIKTAFPYMGGKFYIADEIHSLIPPHGCWVEVFGGSCVVTLSKPPSEVEIINDIDSDIYNFFTQLRDNYDGLMSRLETIPYSRQFYYTWQKEWKQGIKPADPSERAARWFYIINAAIGAHWAAGWSHGGGKNEAGTWQSKIANLRWVTERLKHVQIENLDFEKLIKTYDGTDTCFYNDPPYVGIAKDEDVSSGITYYQSGKFCLDEHIRLARVLNSVAGKVILSYYPHDVINELYQVWHRVELKIPKHSSWTQNDPHREKPEATELLLLNYDPVKSLPLFGWKQPEVEI